MAQADADVNDEKASPDEMTYRKLDVTHKLEDAVHIDAQTHQYGFWPSFVRVVQRLSPLGAYRDYTTTDYSLAYVPYGNSPTMTPSSMVKVTVSESPATPPVGQEKPLLGAACQISSSGMSQLNWQKLVRTTTIPAMAGMEPQTVNFFSTDKANEYQVVILGSGKQLLANFVSPVASSSVEDIDHDGVYELVIRQYRFNPFEPVKVYRYTPCSFQLDKTVANFFS
jgi:hypothetical protein